LLWLARKEQMHVQSIVTHRFAARRREVFAALLVAVALWASRASASLSLAVSLSDLARASRAIAIATLIEQHAEWQGRRIITLQRLRVDSVVAGDLPGQEVVIRSLGGTVGNITQTVEGEAEFAPGQASLVFLNEAADRALRVTARAQGQFPIRTDSAGYPALFRNAHLGTLIKPAETSPRSLPAVAALHGMRLTAALSAISSAWRQTHAH
jgi:hypothetical protein